MSSVRKSKATIAAVALADQLEDAGDVDQALAVLSRAIGNEPDQPYLLALRGRLLRTQKAWQRTIADFDTAIALKPDVPTTLFFRGTCHANLENFDQAIADLRACIRLQPRSADAYWHLGTIYSYRGEPTAAVNAYRRAFELDPEWSRELPGRIEELQEQNNHSSGPKPQSTCSNLPE
ncbi:MAG: tetratricopeptide repeat protein [Myxococcales bacterium]|nr:tetratricopeptide repeat protein [Myxococcales bacterium]